jgi:hypothetical protein
MNGSGPPVISLPSGAILIDVTSPDLLTALSLDGISVSGDIPDWVLASDGSGTPSDAGTRAPGGFGVLAVSRDKCLLSSEAT